MDGDFGRLQTAIVAPDRHAVGLFHGIPAEQYHASPGVSQSKLKTFVEPGGPALYRAGIRKETASLKFGGVFHTATLEPHLLDHEYAVTDLDRTGTKLWEEAERRAGGRRLVKRTDYDRAQRMRDAIMAHPTARQFLTPELETEVSMFWDDAETGLPCRGRWDGLRRDWGVAVDIKSTEDATEDAFKATISKWGYDWQEAFYRTGYQAASQGALIDTMVFVAVEKEPPFLIGVYDIDPDSVAEARDDIAMAMRELKACHDTGIWPGLPPELIRLRPPRNRFRRHPY